jgi:hypothetical protein
MVLGPGIAGFSILPSSNPVHFDLKVTSDLVRMRGRGGGGPKLGGAFLCKARRWKVATLTSSGNGSKWRPLGPRVGLI